MEPAPPPPATTRNRGGCCAWRRPFGFAIATGLVAALLGISPLVAQDQPQANPANDAGQGEGESESSRELIQLNLPRTVRLEVLIKYVSDRLDVNILYGQNVGRQQVSLVTPAKISEKSLLPLLKRVLRMNELVMVDDPRAGWKRIKQAENLGRIAKRVEKLGQKVDASDIVTHVFRPRHVSPQQLKQMLTWIIHEAVRCVA